MSNPPASTKLYRIFREMWGDAEIECEVIKSETIDRCAQVAEAFSQDAAAAIRKLKESA